MIWIKPSWLCSMLIFRGVYFDSVRVGDSQKVSWLQCLRVGTNLLQHKLPISYDGTFWGHWCTWVILSIDWFIDDMYIYIFIYYACIYTTCFMFYLGVLFSVCVALSINTYVGSIFRWLFFLGVIDLHVYTSINLFVSICLSIHPSIHPSIQPSSIDPSIYLPIVYLSAGPSICIWCFSYVAGSVPAIYTYIIFIYIYFGSCIHM